jgi:hypothetical protein
MNDNQLLAHAVKALAYRLTKATNGSNENFGAYKVSDHTRSPNEILNHMCDLVIKTITMIQEGHFKSAPPAALDFGKETTRLTDRLQELQTIIATTSMVNDVSKRLLQGPILDIATHIGQLALLNGLNGNRIPKESYYNADIN